MWIRTHGPSASLAQAKLILIKNDDHCNGSVVKKLVIPNQQHEIFLDCEAAQSRTTVELFLDRYETAESRIAENSPADSWAIADTGRSAETTLGIGRTQSA